MLDAATDPATAHLDRPDPGDVLGASADLTAAYAEEPVTYTGTLPIPRRVVAFVADLHERHFASLRTRSGRRSLTAWAVCWCRVMLHNTHPDQFARDTGIARSTAHLRMAESEKIVAAQAPCLKEALAAASESDYRHVNLDGTLIETDRVSLPGPTTRKNTKRSGPKRLKVDLS